jgi:hypothetical protein
MAVFVLEKNFSKVKRMGLGRGGYSAKDGQKDLKESKCELKVWDS